MSDTDTGYVVLLVLAIASIVIVAVMRQPIARAVLFLTEVIVIVLVIVLTVIGAMMGYAAGYALVPFAFQMHPVGYAVIGGIVGFAISAILASFVLTLAQIERNTRPPANPR